MKRDPSDEACPICGTALDVSVGPRFRTPRGLCMSQGIETYEDVIGPAPAGEPQGGMSTCRRCYDAHASGAIRDGMTFGQARAIVNAGDAARLALDAGDA